LRMELVDRILEEPLVIHVEASCARVRATKADKFLDVFCGGRQSLALSKVNFWAQSTFAR
ncbi:hypothetical protein, partial [Mesorhizobium sp.]